MNTETKIRNLVIDEFGITEKKLLSRKRDFTSVNARKAYAYFMTRNTDATTTELGKTLGHRDHSSVCYYIKTAYAHIEYDKYFRDKINNIQNNLDKNNILGLVEKLRQQRKDDFMCQVDWNGIINELNKIENGL